MGQYRTMMDYALPNRIANLERQLIALKSPQNYGTEQAQSISSNTLNFVGQTSNFLPDTQFVCAILRFVGSFPGQTAIAKPHFLFHYNDGTSNKHEPRAAYVRGTSSPHILEFCLYSMGVYDSSWYLGEPLNFNVDVWVQANMSGVLQLVYRDDLNWMVESYG